MLTGQDLKSLQNTFTQEENTVLEQDYLIEHLDYSYISQCQNVQELRKLEQVLDSGKEGEYPQLLEFTRNKISEISPEETDEKYSFENLVNSLRNFEKDSELENFENFENLEKFKNLDSKTRFDKEFSKIGVFSKEKVEVFAKSDFSVRESLAEREKEKGNECFKASEYNDAIVYYTRSLQIMKRAHVFTNRANSYLKIGQYEKAENDSSAALEMNDTLFMFKAFIRRAEARRKRGKLWDALQDVDSAIKIDPTSGLASNLRNQIEKEYKKVEGDLAKDTRGPKSRIKIEQVEEIKNELEPSSIIEVTDEEAGIILKKAFKESKDTKSLEKSKDERQKADEFLQGLQALSPSFDFGKSKVDDKESINSMFQVQDIDQLDDDIDVFKKEIESPAVKINVTDKEKIDDDCEAFQKELGLVNKLDDVKTKDKMEMDDDCTLFKTEILSKNADSCENAFELTDSVAKEGAIMTPALEQISFKPPKSSIEFEATWNSIKHDIKQFASYLGCIEEKDMMKFLAMVSNADLHIDVILSTEYMEDKDILTLLEFMPTLPRFKVVKSFMTRKQKAQLATTLNKLKSEVDCKRVSAIFDTFKL